MRVNIVPMSGSGSRFSKVGYLLPKPLIPVSGNPMIVKVIESMPEADKWIFIVRREHVDQYAIDTFITNYKSDAIIVIDDNPHGQASTCMLAMPFVKDDDSIFIAACDNSFLYNKEKYESLTKDTSVDSILWTFTKDELLVKSPTSWGWVRLSDDGVTVKDMSVKVPVSQDPYHDHAVVASFYFRSAKDFKDAYKLMEEADYKINNELYVDAMPIFLNRLGKRTVIFDVDLYVSWGKPDDLYVYEYNEFLYSLGKLKDERWNTFFSREKKITT